MDPAVVEPSAHLAAVTRSRKRRTGRSLGAINRIAPSMGYRANARWQSSQQNSCTTGDFPRLDVGNIRVCKHSVHYLFDFAKYFWKTVNDSSTRWCSVGFEDTGRTCTRQLNDQLSTGHSTGQKVVQTCVQSAFEREENRLSGVHESAIVQKYGRSRSDESPIADQFANRAVTGHSHPVPEAVFW